MTNSIPEDTELAGSQIRPRCDLRNNPLLPFEDRNEAIRAPPSQPYLGDSFDGNNAGGNANGNGDGDGDLGNSGVLDPGAPGSGSLGGVNSFGQEGSANSVYVMSTSPLVIFCFGLAVYLSP